MESSQKEAVFAELDKLLRHPDFSNKRRASEFLRFVVENTISGDVSRLKESVIGVEVYRRDPYYNPKEEPIVRTEARRLRALLEGYYAANGRGDSWVITIPKGSYIAKFERRALLPTAMDAKSPAAPTGPKRKFSFGRIRLLGGLLCASLIATAAFTTFVNSRNSRKVWTAQPFSRLDGAESFAAFSPDGKEVVFARSQPDQTSSSLYLQGIQDDSAKQLTSGTAEDTRPAWSPDGQTIAFIRLSKRALKTVETIDVKTGRISKVVELEGSNPWLCIVPRLSWSRDGRTLFTSESSGPGEACGIVAIDVNTHAMRRVTQPPAGTLSDLEPSVSPDGREVAFLRDAGQMSGDVYVVSADGGPAHRVTFDNRDILGFSWSADGKGFIVSSRRGNGIFKLWRLGQGGRSAEQLTDGSSAPGFPAPSPLGNQVAFTTYRNLTDIWQIDAHGEKQIIDDGAGNSNPQLSPDGSRLVFRSDVSGAFEVWISDRDGRNAHRLTRFNGPAVSNPVWSPDASTIAFECRPDGHSDICLISADGAAPARRFTALGSDASLPSWSRDGRFLYFSSNRSGRWEIYKQALASGEPFAITHQGGMRAMESWDGRWLYVHRGAPYSGLVPLPVTATSEGQQDSAAPAILFDQIGPDNWNDWETGPDGIVFLRREVSGGTLANCMDSRGAPDAGRCRTLFTLTKRVPSGDRTFSLAPDGKSFLFVGERAHESQIRMLVAQAGP